MAILAAPRSRYRSTNPPAFGAVVILPWPIVAAYGNRIPVLVRSGFAWIEHRPAGKVRQVKMFTSQEGTVSLPPSCPLLVSRPLLPNQHPNATCPDALPACPAATPPAPARARAHCHSHSSTWRCRRRSTRRSERQSSQVPSSSDPAQLCGGCAHR